MPKSLTLFALGLIETYENGNHSQVLAELKLLSKVTAAAVVAQMMVMWMDESREAAPARSFAAWLSRQS